MISLLTKHLFEYKKVYKRNDNHFKINKVSFSLLLSYRLIESREINKHVRYFYIIGRADILYRGFEYKNIM